MKRFKMKTTKQKIVLIATLVSAAAAISFLAAGCNHGHRHMTPERAKKMASWKIEDVLDEVDASDAQIEAFENAASSVIDDAFAMKSGHGEQHKKLAKELAKQTPDEAKIKEMVDAHIEEMRDVAYNTVDTMLGAWNTLSVNQKRALIKEMEKHHQEMGH